MNALHSKGLHLSCKTVKLLNGFFLEHLSVATGNFWTYCGQSLAGLCLLTEVNTGYKKKCGENENKDILR